MAEGFCEHLHTYESLFEGAETSYGECLELMDRILAGEHSKAIKGQLMDSLNLWELQTRELRNKFVQLTEKGSVLLPAEEQNPTPVCGHCGQEVKRLAFPEFVFEDDGSVHFRGQRIKSPEPVPA